MSHKQHAIFLLALTTLLGVMYGYTRWVQHEQQHAWARIERNILLPEK